MGFLSTVLSVTLAASSMMQSSMEAAVPGLDVNGTLFLVNRDYMISEQYVPPVRAAKVKGAVRNMHEDAATALEEMFKAGKAEGKVQLVSVSGFRSFQTQKNIYSRKLKNTGSADKANEYVAIPGASEHQLGLAMDVGSTTNSSLTPSFGSSKGGKWVAANCHLFGFIIRYQQGWESITGYNAEPWHVRYIGKEHAQAIYEKNVPFETYLKDLQVSTLLDIIESN